MKTKADQLHRIHAAHDGKAKGWRVDIEDQTWRTEGNADMEQRKAMAVRLAVCWNVLEGIPTTALLAGAVLDFYRTADALAQAVDRGAPASEMKRLVKRLRDADKAHHLTDTNCRCGERKRAGDQAKLFEEAALP
jgi:hypothetical protein